MQELELLTNEAHIAMMQDIIARVSFDETENLSYSLPLAYIKEWTEGETYKKGRIIKRHGVKYIVRVDQIIASQHVYPETVSARVQYKPYQGLIGQYRWAYGERIVEGMRREYEGVIYTALMNVDDNEATQALPNTVPGVWRPETTEINI